MRQQKDLKNEGSSVVTVTRHGQFSLTSVREARGVVVRASGRLVLGHGAQETVWASHLGLDSGGRIALDLSCVNDVDAHGLGVLAGLAGDALQRGIPMSVTAAKGAHRFATAASGR
jgi:anti-anti-sigma regulatory factor